MFMIEWLSMETYLWLYWRSRDLTLSLYRIMVTRLAPRLCPGQRFLMSHKHSFLRARTQVMVIQQMLHFLPMKEKALSILTSIRVVTSEHIICFPKPQYPSLQPLLKRIISRCQ
ncbi:hypothetical protein CUN63_00955 [Pseudomonas sp. ACM7]|nr:hypothetical protein CUN63_00955 [Pseudomonas sp. ACM7]